jgi:hypothetical protein
MKLLYLAKPTYGGWVTFTAHMSLKYNYDVIKCSKRTEKRSRPFGYGVNYQNMSIEDILLIPEEELLVVACDKHKRHVLDCLRDGTSIVIHDPTEFKTFNFTVYNTAVNLERFNIFTIRKTVKDLLKEKFDLDAVFKLHPFYAYDLNAGLTNAQILALDAETFERKGAVATSRIDFDKHTDVIIEANKHGANIDIYGKKNDLYVYHKIMKNPDLNEEFEKSYKGSFGKSFEEINKILIPAKFMVDMSAIKGDGGGSQYSFLEAIYSKCVLIISEKWIEGVETMYSADYNCCVTKPEGYDLYMTIDRLPLDEYEYMMKGAYHELLKPHLNVKW